jgi:hypothetical protein
VGVVIDVALDGAVDVSATIVADVNDKGAARVHGAV